MGDSKVLEVLKRHKVVEFYEKPRKLSSGSYSNIFYDVPKVYENQRSLNILAKKLYEKIGRKASAVASCGGGLPLANAMAKKYKMNLISLEKHDEENYIRHPIHGYTPSSGEKVEIVDDVCTKKRTLKRMWMDLAPTGCNIVGFGVVINRGEKNVQLFGNTLAYLVHADELRSIH